MPRILIIDDEPDLRLALTATLEDNGYDVVEGSDGSQALELALQHSPDAIILDINMPVMDGESPVQVIERLIFLDLLHQHLEKSFTHSATCTIYD